MRGTDSTYALEDALVELEGGYRAKMYPTGQAAIAVVLLAYLKAGDHVLITDAVYEPVRRLCAEQLSRWGIAFSYYRPDGSDLPDRDTPQHPDDLCGMPRLAGLRNDGPAGGGGTGASP